jgi:sugar phosphate isomerase/epimerase
MTRQNVMWQNTFDGLRPEQIDERWVSEGWGLEAYVFDGHDLADSQNWLALQRSLYRARQLGVSALSMHFPTDHADWVGDPEMFAALLRFCDLAAAHQADGVVLHANQFVAQSDWMGYDLAGARSNVVEQVAELTDWLRGYPLWIGIENLPLIGSQGIDYDPIFVYPNDFNALAEIGSPLLGVTWDLCHWAVTHSTESSIAQLQRRRNDFTMLDLPALPIRHLHFGSYYGHAMPFWTGHCFEGATPQRGEAEPTLLAAALRHAIDAADPAAGRLGVVFEVQEADYQARSSCWETLQWVRTTPELAELAVTAGRNVHV